jgi:hypothetical protein
MVGAPRAGLATLFAVTVKLPDDLMLHPLGAEARELEQWLTIFHLASVVLDPYTNESSWILKSAVRVLEGFRGSDARVNFIVTADEDDTRRFLGPLCDQFLVFCDPNRTAVKAMGLERLPAFVFVRVDGELVAKAEGWNPVAWREVAEVVAETAYWSAPLIPAAGDPSPFAGSRAAG